VRWMDLDRGRRLDSTNALPMMPVCLEVCRMATRRIARDEGLATRVAETLVELLFVAGGGLPRRHPVATGHPRRAHVGDHGRSRGPPPPSMRVIARPRMAARGGAYLVAVLV
jgi:hypothetical protein